MEIVDANVVLRYLLEDNKSLFEKSRQVLEQNSVHIPTEVLAEIVYVLEKVYNVPRVRITEALARLLAYPNINLSDNDVYDLALSIYKSENIDIVDAMLVGYHRVHHHTIHSFDKKVQKLCKATS